MGTRRNDSLLIFVDNNPAMPATCLNCNHPISGNYCSHCGQKTTVKKLDWKVLLGEFLHFFTHIEKGFLHTTRELILRPGSLYKTFLEGRRKGFHKPVSFLLIWIGIYLIVYNLAGSLSDFPEVNYDSVFFSFNPESWKIFNRYRSLIELLIMPFSAFTGWLILARPRLNYAEVLVTSFYFMSVLFILLSMQFIIVLVLGLNFHSNFFDMVNALLFLGWGLYSAVDFYRRYNIKFLLPRIILSTIAGGMIYIVLSQLYVKFIMILS